MEKRIRVRIRNGVADVQLARGARMNAIDQEMFEALVDTGSALQATKGLRAVVLSGEGRAFCAGLDMASMQALVQDGGRKLIGMPRNEQGANLVQQAVLVWRELAVPVIAAIHGVAFGGGLQLALGADLRFVTPDAKLSVMEIKWGLVPDMAAMLLLRQLLRDDHFRDLVYTGRILTGEEAVKLGLASRISGDPYADAISYASEIAERSPDAIRAAKRLLNLPATSSPAEILLAESREQQALIGTPNQLEAMHARLEKRPPIFRD